MEIDVNLHYVSSGEFSKTAVDCLIFTNVQFKLSICLLSSFSPRLENVWAIFCSQVHSIIERESKFLQNFFIKFFVNSVNIFRP